MLGYVRLCQVRLGQFRFTFCCAHSGTRVGRLGQVRLGQFRFTFCCAHSGWGVGRLCQVKLGQVRLRLLFVALTQAGESDGQVRLGQVRLSQVRLVQVRLCQFRFSFCCAHSAGRVGRLGQVRLSQVRLVQVRLGYVSLGLLFVALTQAEESDAPLSKSGRLNAEATPQTVLSRQLTLFEHQQSP